MSKLVKRFHSRGVASGEDGKVKNLEKESVLERECNLVASQRGYRMVPYRYYELHVTHFFFSNETDGV